MLQLSRARFLQLFGAAFPTTLCAQKSAPSNAGRRRISELIAAFDAQLIHRTATAIDNASTDCFAALPSRMADLCVRLLPLKRGRATFPLPRMNTVMVWHQRTNEDPGAKLFRDIVLECGRAR
jgi:hypothetical protein